MHVMGDIPGIRHYVEKQLREARWTLRIYLYLDILTEVETLQGRTNKYKFRSQD